MIDLANVQLEKGYTRIANILLEMLSKTALNGTQWRILLVVFRFTYGFNRKEASLSESFIARATNINRKQINREINELIEFRILCVNKPATFNTSRTLSFNKDFDLWEVSSKKLTDGKSEGINEKAGTTESRLDDTTVNKRVDQERYSLKTNINKEALKTNTTKNGFRKFDLERGYN